MCDIAPRKSYMYYETAQLSCVCVCRDKKDREREDEKAIERRKAETHTKEQIHCINTFLCSTEN